MTSQRTTKTQNIIDITTSKYILLVRIYELLKFFSIEKFLSAAYGKGILHAQE